MSHTLPRRAAVDEATAWSIVLAARRYGPAASRELVLAVPGQAGLNVHLQRGETWQVDAEVEPAAAELLDLYLPLCLTPGRRYVMGQMGQSLDGRIATESGHSQFVTGRADILRLHRLRALFDAVVVGAGTVLADDPRLTVRHASGPNPTRVVLDPRCRLPVERCVFRDGKAPTLLLCHSGAASRRVLNSGVELVSVKADETSLAPERVLDVLARRGLHRVLVEGGGLTVSRFLETGALDRLHVTVAPLIIGSGRPAFTLPPVSRLEGALRPTSRRFALGADVLFDLELR